MTHEKERNDQELFNILIGTTGRYMSNYDMSCFFKPFNSTKDVFFKTSSILTAPIALTITMPAMILFGGVFLLKSIHDLLKGNLNEAKTDIVSCGFILFVMPPVLLIGALLSPLINLIDLIGSAINSINPAVELSETIANPLN